MKRMLCVLAFFLCMMSVLSVSAAQNVVSLHAVYTIETPVSEGYPDVQGELTNGKYGTPVANGNNSYYYRSEEFVGLKNSDAADGVHVILLDLGESYKDLTVFELSVLTEVDAGIRTPKKVVFSISETKDGDYVSVGEATHTDADTDVQKVNVLSVTANEPVEGRFVRCEITPADDAAWTFADELTVLQGKSNISEPSDEQSDASAESVPDTSAELSGVVSESTSEPASSLPDSSADSSVPATGDRGVWSFVLLSAASVLGIAALLGRRRGNA